MSDTEASVVFPQMCKVVSLLIHSQDCSPPSNEEKGGSGMISSTVESTTWKVQSNFILILYLTEAGHMIIYSYKEAREKYRSLYCEKP